MLLPLANCGLEFPKVSVEFWINNLMSIKEIGDSELSVDSGVKSYGSWDPKINIKFGD